MTEAIPSTPLNATSVQERSRTRRFTPRALTVGATIVVVSSALSLLFRALTPPYLILGAVDDDQLGVRLGHSLMSGWLGPFDLRTLEKPPGFPLFIAVANLTHLPFLI